MPFSCLSTTNGPEVWDFRGLISKKGHRAVCTGRDFQIQGVKSTCNPMFESFEWFSSKKGAF